MRILHTSDWHLGQNFYAKSRAAEHEAFLDWLLEAAMAHQVDAIIVAGDIFDTGAPPSYARELYNRFVVKLQGAQCPLIVLGGNHDSVATLNESRELLACLNTQVIASAQLTPESQATLLYRRDGEPGAVLCPVPFLRPRDVLRSLSGQSGREKQQQLLEAISQHYQQSYEAACQLRGERNLPIIATGHLTTVGVTKSDAVRDIYIGTLDAFPADRFPPADYIALGHIHRAQKVAGCEHIRYSGSPIALSFDETGKEKSVYLVEFADGKLRDVTALPVPVSQPLAVLKGSLESITAQLEQWRDAPDEPRVWLDIEIDTGEFLHDMHRQISQLTESLPVEVVLLRRSREMRERALGTLSTETLSELGVEEVFERRLELEALEEPEKAQLRTLFARTLESLHEEDEA
ncbi:exonuclease subunit SbcD [Cronobacter turicensis]|jgi:exonuclease SbcD|uniref:exonuclease subunit SbcD n=1 Tax=Cronobacter turicensis TaxID=413502 RepID=UPI00137578C4|nr:exonuclease subunit SbcD [Cronobacter turicensis]EKM0363851.1 exonuclease subunit SbcD [Cronobacter turicensis]ELQ6020121.1 exonuclease subunit SbcD [Cronobacter turicensis]ELQ6076503.1 exonuclease subunit SbcD [Cronobacter turicensis]ELQ6183309.1 exonuclease subunit SbcD [Cronobacter turicensis]ELQ6232596.1 exonuclease subunit SbcD [Cronobacter turicensis]